jgi:hypothetical protein
MSKTGSEYIAMAKHAGPPESGADNSADHPADHLPGDSGQNFSQDIDQDVDPAAASPPARFGRLALWVASASALTLGVLATVAYGVWFDQDQRAYAKAMTVAQQTLSAGVAAVPQQPSLSAGVAVVPEQQALPTATPIVPAQQAAPAVGSRGSGVAASAAFDHARGCYRCRSYPIDFARPARVNRCCSASFARAPFKRRPIRCGEL